MASQTQSPTTPKTGRLYAGLLILISAVTLPLIATAAEPTMILAVLSLLAAIVLLVLQFRNGGRRV